MGDAGRRFEYPPALKGDVVDVHHGERVADPYRWLEEPDAAGTKAWVTAQNKVTRGYLDEAAGDVRARALGRLKETFTYDKWGTPFRRGDHFYVWMQRGLQNQYILYQLRGGLDADEGDMRVLIDPNRLAADGTSSVGQMAFSQDGRYVAYGVNEAGSDWATIYVTDTESGERLEADVLKWAKFYSLTWRHDGSGFYYCRFDAPVLADGATAGTETAVVRGQRLMFHALRTSQAEDELVHAEPDHPKRLFGAVISDDGRYLFRSTAEDCAPVNMVHYADLMAPPPAGGVGAVTWVPLVTTLDASFSYIANDGPRVLLETNLNAPRCRVVSLDLSTPGLTGGPAVSLPLEELIPQHPVDVLSSVDAVNGVEGGQLVLVYRRDVHDVLYVHSMATGERLVEIPTPAAGCVAVAARRRDDFFLFKFVSFLYPGSIYHVDMPFLLGDKAPPSGAPSNGGGVGGAAAAVPGLRLWREMTVPGFDASAYQTEQVFYPSKDGTKIPAFTVRRRPEAGGEVSPPEETPCLLYGYGGFMISIMPYFSTSWLMWFQCFRGVLVIANIRGGSEYGTEWHVAGIITRKQNVFDDFAAAAEYLTTSPTAITVPSKLAIMGGSNGGLLVGASINQRPALFGAAVAQVGVHDMLRFASFTIGSAWASDYGDVTNAEHYGALRAYSPVHNVGDPDATGVPYPATLLTTGDHDDRVCPAHSLKFAAALQARAGGSATQVASGRPLLIRIDTNAGHGAGKSTEKALEETADTYTFLSRALDAPFHPPTAA